MPTPQQRKAVEPRSLSGADQVYALEISHRALTTPIRIVADTQEHTVGSDTYIPLAFRVELPQDKQGEIREARLQVDNVGRELMKWVELSDGGRGAVMRVMRLIQPEGTESVSVIDYQVVMDCGVAEVTNEYVNITLTTEPVFNRPSVLIKHDSARSPGLF